MIEYIKIDGFRCYDNFLLNFNQGINLLVGENDAGKSSLLSVIRILKGELHIDNDDFKNGSEKINFEIKINGNIYFFEKLKENLNEKIIQIISIIELKNKLRDDLFSDDEISKHIRVLGGDLRGNKKAKLKSILDGIIENEKKIEIQKNILLEELKNIKFEDGKSFSDIQQNFKNFIKDDVNKIWNEEFIIMDGENSVNKKLSDLVNDKLRAIKKRKEQEYKAILLPTIKEIIPNIDGMQINLNSNLGNFSSYESKVDFIHDNNLINIDKKGDGTKRRITLALFKQESLKNEETNNIYLFDEPDTHLNLRVQQDLIGIFTKLVENGHQIIFTSHSPFILNLIPISNITLLKNILGEKTEKIELNIDSIAEFNQTLYDLGIQNIDIFFSKYFLFIEGDTEERFFSKAYYKKYGEPFEKKFIRQINCRGINNECIFMDNFCSIIGDGVKIISIVDNDYVHDNKANNIIEKLKLKFEPNGNFNLFRLGTNEFEDEFNSNDIYNCFTEKLNNNGVNSVQELEDLRLATTKFSSLLKIKKGLSKPEIGEILAEYFEFDNLPLNIKGILEHINGL